MSKKIEEVIEACKPIDIELAAYMKAISHADNEATFEAMAAHVDELMRERGRAMGLPEDEIANIEQESEAAVDAQISAEIAALLDAVPKPIARKIVRAAYRYARMSREK
jgi:hypothetical protein